MGKPGDLRNEELLYKLFGVNAELLIDHTWGWEPCTMADIKAYRPESSSVGSGQVLQCPYEFGKARLVLRETADALALELVDQGLVTDQIVLTVGYDKDDLKTPGRRERYRGEITTDRYGRQSPKHAHGTVNLGRHTSSSKVILHAATALFDWIVDRELLVRRLYVTASRGGGGRRSGGIRFRVAGPVHGPGGQATPGGGRSRPAGAGEADAAGHAGHQEEVRQECHSERDEPGGRGHRERTEQPDRGAQGMNGPYDDIIEMPHPTSEKYPRMPATDRTAQFAPFAALTGYGAAVKEAARRTEERREADEERKTQMDLRLQILLDLLPEQPEIAVTYFKPDARKSGGAYVTVHGQLKKYDDRRKTVILESGERIPAEDIWELEGSVFPEE